MISFVPSTPLGFGLFALILLMGPKRGLPLLFATMPFGVTAVFSATGIGNVVLPDFCAIAYVLSVLTRVRLDNILAALSPGHPGFALMVLCVIIVFGAWCLPRLFADRVEVYGIQHIDGRAFVGLERLTPSSAQIAQCLRFLLGAVVFWAISSVSWKNSDWRTAHNALLAASAGHIAVSLADWVSYPFGLAHLLDPIRTIFQAILLDQQFGPVRRLIGGQTEPASFGIYTIGLFAFWLRMSFGCFKLRWAGALCAVMAVLALRSTSSATILNLCLFSLGFFIWHWHWLSHRRAIAMTLVCILGATPALFASALAILDHSAYGRDLVNSLFFEKVSSVSGQERLGWNAQAWQNFRDSYGLGVGIGSVRASGWVFAVLGNLGLPGIILFGWFLASSLRRNKTAEPLPTEVSAALRCGCLAVLFQSTLTTPFPNLGLPFFAMLALSVGLQNSRPVFGRASSFLPEVLAEKTVARQ